MGKGMNIFCFWVAQRFQRRARVWKQSGFQPLKCSMATPPWQYRILLLLHHRFHFSKAEPVLTR